MRTHLRFAILLLVAFAFAYSIAFATETPLSPAPVPVALAEASLAGMQVSLTTSGYKFLLAEPDSAAVAPKPVRESFVASALLANRSNTDITFTFPTPAAAAVKWTFRIFNSAGIQLWQSDADIVTPQVFTEATLDKRGRWKRLIQVPLRVDGKLLEPGIYTLEASIDADKSVGATALFEVALPPIIPQPEKNTGIKGNVLLPGEGDRPAAGALVNIIELRANASPLNRAPFAWTGHADASGRFQVVTPAGRFRVTASPALPIHAGGGIPPKTVEVTVTAGAFSEVMLRIGGTQPPVNDTGIKGIVLFGPIKPVALEGEPNERPLPGALVRIQEVGSTPIRTHISDANGRFAVPLPPGKYRVSAGGLFATGLRTGLPQLVDPINSTDVEVAVEQGKFSEVTLYIDSGIR